MRFESSLVALAILSRVAHVQAKTVFAHFLIGLTASSTSADWEDDITKAKAAGIDGFALNIAPQDSYTTASLQNAANAANTIGGFSLFLSFDYLSGGAWDAEAVKSTINSFVTTAGQAQFRYKNQPLVSTFEGVSSKGDWPGIKAATNCFFIPDWTSAGPGGLPLDIVDGAFNWDAWPHGPQAKDTAADVQWQQALGGKPYMMGVSPWFYTNLPQYNKNWGWRGDDLWSTRWKQAADLQPEFVEIITWNDYGESHYIGPIRSAGIVSGASRYVSNNPHDAWRNILPYYISTYKNGVAPAITEEQVVFYHKPNPSTSCSDGGTVGNQPGDPSFTIEEVSLDQISIDVLVHSSADVCVQVGTNPVIELRAENAGASHFAFPFNGQTGAVTVSLKRDGQTVATAKGPGISTNCPNGLTNFNAIVEGSL